MPDPIRKYDTVVLTRDIPDAGLRAGEVGAVSHLYTSNVVEVEFATRPGAERTSLTLPTDAVRLARNDDLAARPAA